MMARSGNRMFGPATQSAPSFDVDSRTAPVWIAGVSYGCLRERLVDLHKGDLGVEVDHDGVRFLFAVVGLPSDVRVVVGDITDAAAIDTAVGGADAVISALGPSLNRKATGLPLVD